MALIDGKLLGQTKRSAPGYDGHFMDRIRAGNQFCHKGVTRFVIGGILSFLKGDDHTLSLNTHEHFVLGVLEVAHIDSLFTSPCRDKRRFIDEVLQIGAGKSWCASGNNGKVDRLINNGLPGVDL